MADRLAQFLATIQGLPRCSPGAVFVLALLFAGNSSLGPLITVLSQLQAGQSLWMLDFPSFHMAADSVFNRDLSPYAAGTRLLYQQELGFPLFPFLYPPYALPLLYPLSLLDYSTGLAAALAVNGIAAFALFCLLHRLFLAGIDNPVAYWSAIVFLFFCGSLRESVAVGQVNLIAALAVVLAWRLLRAASHPIIAGALIGVAVVTKTYFLPLLILFLPRLEWRPVLGTAIAVITFSLYAAALAPASLWAEWLVEVAPKGRYGTTLFRELPMIVNANQSINGVLIRLLGDGTSSLVLAAGSAAAMLTTVAAVLWRRRDESAATYFDAALPVALLTIFLTAPLSWPHHLVFVTPAVLCLWSDAARRGALKEMTVIGAVGAWAGAPWPLPALQELSPYLTFLPFPGIVALWLLSLRHAALRAAGADKDVSRKAAVPGLSDHRPRASGRAGR